MKTSEYKTKTIFRNRSNPIFTNAARPIALDIGYSSVKGFSPDMVFCFPSYAIKVGEMPSIIGNPEAKELYYRDDNTGEVWLVGATAQNMISSSNMNDNLLTMYGRNRYNEMFKVIARVGLAFGLIKEGQAVNFPQIVLQTGLPPEYIKSDAPLFRDALTGIHSFSIKVGAFMWQSFKFTLMTNQIRFMPQPMGTLTSIATGKDGKQTLEAPKLYKSSLLIADPGFGTFDTFHIKNNINVWKDTSDALGMKQVFQNTCDAIFKQTENSVELTVPAIQPYLKSGEVRKLDRRLMKSVPFGFSNILEAESYKVCMQAVERMKDVYNYFTDIDYLVITGGTGAAWSNYIRDYLKDMDTLTILSGNMNDDLPYIFSNVRGYYMFLINRLAVEYAA